MNFSKHARTRSRQRGFDSFLVGLIENYGRVENAPDGATKIFFGKKEAQNILREVKGFTQVVIRAIGGSLVIKDNCVITVYKQR